MSIDGQGHSLTLVKGHSDFKVKCLTFGLYTQVSDSGPLGPLVLMCNTVDSLKYRGRGALANSADQDQTAPKEQSDQGLQHLPISG